MCGCLTFSSEAAGFIIFSLMILTAWEKMCKEKYYIDIRLRKNCSVFGKSWILFFIFRKKGITGDTDALKKCFKTILSAANNYLILLKELFGSTTEVLYRHDNTSLIFWVSAAQMCLLWSLKPDHQWVTCGWVSSSSTRGKQTFGMWWRQDHSLSRTNCSSCGDGGFREGACCSPE